MNRTDRAQRLKRMAARRLGKAQRARDRGHRTGGQSKHPVNTLPLTAEQRAQRYGGTGWADVTSTQRRRMVHKMGHATAAGRR